jgi:hypothetical protein
LVGEVWSGRRNARNRKRIAIERAILTILNRRGLEKLACECYAGNKSNLVACFGPPRYAFTKSGMWLTDGHRNSRALHQAFDCPRRHAAHSVASGDRTLNQRRRDQGATTAASRSAVVGMHQARRTGEALQRELLDAGDVPRPSTCLAAAPGSVPVARSAARPSTCRHGGERRQHQGR